LGLENPFAAADREQSRTKSIGNWKITSRLLSFRRVGLTFVNPTPHAKKIAIEIRTLDPDSFPDAKPRYRKKQNERCVWLS
jgi:hypothetical protein